MTPLRAHEPASQQTWFLQLAGPLHVTPHVCPKQLTLPAQDLIPVQPITPPSAVTVMAPPHANEPEQPMLQVPLVHVTGPEQAPKPHVTWHDPPPQATSAHEDVAEQSIVQALAAVQSTDVPAPVAAVTEQGMPGGHVTLPAHPPALGQSMMQEPPLHVPASQSAVHAASASPTMLSYAPASPVIASVSG